MSKWILKDTPCLSVCDFQKQCANDINSTINPFSCEMLRDWVLDNLEGKEKGE